MGTSYFLGKIIFFREWKQKPVNIQACCQMKIVCCAKNNEIPSTCEFFFLLFHGIVMSYSKSFWQLLEDCWSTGHVIKTTFSLKDNCISKCWQCTQNFSWHQSLRIIMQTTRENKLITIELLLMHSEIVLSDLYFHLLLKAIYWVMLLLKNLLFYESIVEL